MITLSYGQYIVKYQYTDPFTWTHESIQLLNEGPGLTGQGNPHPYLATRLLVRLNVKCEDIYYANDLMHQYPNILALGILLIEICRQAALDRRGVFSPFE